MILPFLALAGCLAPATARCLAFDRASAPDSTPVQYVNPFIGTGAVDTNSLSGSNFPGACAPFGLVQLSPDTRENPDDPASGYDYKDTSIVGFSHTHLSGTGVADLFDFLFMPYTGKVQWDPRSAFSHQSESAYPGYYGVTLATSGVHAELTATAHAGMHRYTFPPGGAGVSGGDTARILIDLNHSLDKRRNYWVCRIITAQLKVFDDHTVEGYRLITGWSRLRKVYFYAVFSRPFVSDMLRDGRSVTEGGRLANGTNLKGIFNFLPGGQPILVRVGISSVSQAGAKGNLEAEMPDFGFDQVVRKENGAWNDLLSCISVDGTPQQERIFYTGLYHAFTQPNNIADVDSSYMGTDYTARKAADGTHYSTFSLWDTYRAANPLYTLVTPQYTAAFIRSFLRQYETYGYLPIWQLWGDETYCMIGDHAIPVIVDAFFKHIPGVDWKEAYAAVRASSTVSHPGAPFRVLDRYGYFPEDKQSQSVSLTLEVAFDDWCVAQMAKAMGKEDDYKFFLARSQDYRNLFDPETRFFRGKNSRGNWLTPFNPMDYGGNGGNPYTEGNGWQYCMYVPQDMPDLIRLMGGKAGFESKLDSFFTLTARPGDINGNASGFIGQDAHGNEPSHHTTFLYDYAGAPWKTQYYAAKVAQEMYNDGSSGYAGNEDCGQMSAWYIFAAMGFYPVNPACGVYCIGSPQLQKAVIHLASGRTFTVLARGAGGANVYIQSCRLNGQAYDKTYITQRDIEGGGTLEFVMGAKPNFKWGVKTEDAPVGWGF